MEDHVVYERVGEILARARVQSSRRTPVAGSSRILEQELRKRRKNYLGSHITLWSLLETEGVVDDATIDALAHHLSKQTLLFWRYKDEAAEDFCYHFYRLSMFALLSGVIRECVDDIIQLSSVLVRSKEVFRIAQQDLLPPRMFAELFDFLENSDAAFYTPHFEDAVLFTIASFLGVLTEPKSSPQSIESEDRNDG